MALINGDQYVKLEKPTSGVRKGRVISNEDELKKGRIKCVVPGVFESKNKDELPWCYPQQPAQSGGSVESGSFYVPKVGSEVMISFPYDDPYMPVYSGRFHGLPDVPECFLRLHDRDGNLCAHGFLVDTRSYLF